MGAEPYPRIESWQLPAGAIAATLAAVEPAGRSGRESGVLWLGTRASTTVISAVVWPHGPGVIEAAGRWSLTPEVYGAVAQLRREQGLTLLGSAHTHGRGVRVALSGVDRRMGTRVPGILAIVIGNGGADRNPAAWSWNTFEAGAFRELRPRERERRVQVVEEPVALWRADRNGAGPWGAARG